MWKSFKMFLAGAALLTGFLFAGCSQNDGDQQERQGRQHIHGSGGGHHDE